MASNSYKLSLATASYNGSTYVITRQGTPLTLPDAALRCNGLFLVAESIYLAVDTIDTYESTQLVYHRILCTPIETPNMGNSQYASAFLYWLPTEDNLFLFKDTIIRTLQRIKLILLAHQLYPPGTARCTPVHSLL